VGDSSAFGLGVKGEELFSERLRGKLLDRKIDVINFSVVGYNSFQILKTIETNMEKFQTKPSLLIVWGGFNDLEFTRHFFFNDFLPINTKFWMLKNNIKKIIALCQELHIPVVINTIPSLEETENLTDYRDWLLSIQNDKGGVIVNDVLKKFQSAPLKGLYTDYDSIMGLPMVFHPGPEGHRIISESLVEIVERELMRLPIASQQPG
jgi:lysophospholipase L1-like esterase